MCGAMSGDDHRQAQRIKPMRKYSEQSLLAKAKTPGRPHEIDAGLDYLRIHRPWPKTGTPCKFTRLAEEDWPVLQAETALTFAFKMKPLVRLLLAHGAAKEASHFRITP